MEILQLRVITPKKVVLEDKALSVSVPALDGEITVLPRHTNLFTLLSEGVVRIKRQSGSEEMLAIGGGYLQTDGESVNVLVSRAYGQDQIDEEMTKKAIDDAKNILKEAKDIRQRQEATAVLRRSIIDLKLVRRRKKTSPSPMGQNI
ncbi:ATP synthase F1 subunit epsilon [Candidatus Roizmanbacteria bacterium]|jgi:F-type H+-transporting ATPase subunit epsilon|nr:ATP synthase F1 subunit epsilon [Candidatus Roizmanbacteria bacterium]